MCLKWQSEHENIMTKTKSKKSQKQNNMGKGEMDSISLVRNM